MRAAGIGMILAILWSVGDGFSSAQEQPPKDKENEFSPFHKFLQKEYPLKKWQIGPNRVDSPEIQKIYGKQRFYYVFSAPPFPPGANIPEVQEAYRKRLKQFQENYISVTVSMDENGKLEVLAKPADFNRGMRPVKSDADAKVAAAAVLSLYGADRVAPGVVSPDLVMVERTGKGWQATANKRNLFNGSVTFDDKGRVASVSKTYAGPLPP